MKPANQPFEGADVDIVKIDSDGAFSPEAMAGWYPVRNFPRPAGENRVASGADAPEIRRVYASAV
jgi:hypothetical protein